MTDTPPERRASRRFALRLPLSVSYPESEESKQDAQSRDVSARGICFFVDSNIATGTDIEFTLTLPPEITSTDSIHVKCKGRVVRVDDGPSKGKTAIAAVIHEYEFLPEK